MTTTPLPAFGDAAAACPPLELWVQVGSRPILIRVAGPKLAERLFDPMRHIEIAAADPTTADITILAWSVAETGVPAPAGLPLEWTDAARTTIVASFPSAEELPRLSLARPFQRALVSLLAERDLPSVHGGLVAPPDSGAGLLLIGPNGSGKSTACLSAILSGFRLVGEDCLAVERAGPQFIAHSLYCSCNLTQHSQRMFATLPGPLRFPHGAAPDAKAVMILPPTGPQSPMARSSSIAAIVFPQITSAAGDSRIVSVSRSEAYRRLMPGLRLMRYFEPEKRQKHHDAIAALVAELPCFRIDLGTSLLDIPPPLRQLATALQ